MNAAQKQRWIKSTEQRIADAQKLSATKKSDSKDFLLSPSNRSKCAEEARLLDEEVKELREILNEAKESKVDEEIG